MFLLLCSRSLFDSGCYPSFYQIFHSCFAGLFKYGTVETSSKKLLRPNPDLWRQKMRQSLRVQNMERTAGEEKAQNIERGHQEEAGHAEPQKEAISRARLQFG
jgi:hypothetical protein